MNEPRLPDGPTDPAFDPDQGADPAPGLLSVLWNFTEDDDLGSAQRLADAFGALVLEPTRWPEGTQKREYVLNPPNPVSPGGGRAAYGIAAVLPEHPVRLIVTGRRGLSPHQADRNGWFAVPDLAEFGGLVRDDGLVSHACVQREGLTIHATMFPSVGDAVATASSLRIVAPTEGS